MKAAQPSNLEMQVLSVLWNQGPSTARAVLEAIPDGKPRAYTTILSVLQVMEKKGLVSHQPDGNRHVYAPKVKEGAVVGLMLKSMVKTIFGGSATNAMQHLLNTSEVSESDIAEMRALLDNYKNGKKEKKG